MKRLLLVFGALMLVPAAAPADTRAGLKAAFAERLEAIASSVDGAVGYTVVDLKTGDRFERQQADVFPTASTIKLAMLYELVGRPTRSVCRWTTFGRSIGGTRWEARACCSS
jgi:beta-lactamase class A